MLKPRFDLIKPNSRVHMLCHRALLWGSLLQGWRAWGADSVKSLVWKHENLTSYYYHLWWQRHIHQQVLILLALRTQNTGESRTPGPGWPARLTKLSPGLMTNHVLNKYGGEQLRKIPGINFWPLHIHLCAHHLDSHICPCAHICSCTYTRLNMYIYVQYSLTRKEALHTVK